MSQLKDREKRITKESTDSFSSMNWLKLYQVLYIDLFSWMIKLTGTSFILIGAANIYSIAQNYDKSNTRLLTYILNQSTDPLLQVSFGSGAVLAGAGASEAIKRSRISRLSGTNGIKSLPQTRKGEEVMEEMSRQDLFKKAISEFEEKHGKIEEKDLVFQLSRLPEREDPFLKAVKEERSIAFIIPHGKPEYEKYALHYLERAEDSLEEKNRESFKMPKHTYYEENEENIAYWSGDITPKGEVVIVVSPGLCG